MSSIGAISVGQQKSEDQFMNPNKYAEIEMKKQKEVNRKKSKLMDENYNAQVQKGWYEQGERTIHKDIIPARERIEFYKRKLPREPSYSLIQDSTSTRPTTKSSTTRAGTAKTGATRLKTAQPCGRLRTAQNGTRADTVYGQSFRPSFNTFYTSGDKVEFDSLMRVESKGSYASYVPTDHIVEQKLQKMWRETKNREVAEKRVNDELQKTMKDWGDAKSRYEEDIQRKTENMWFGSNFRARAFVRQTKAKKIDYNRNHLNDSDGSSLMSESEAEEIEQKESKIIEGEGEGEGDDSQIKEMEPEDKPYKNSDLKESGIIPAKKQKIQRAHTAGRSKRKPHMPRLIDSSRDKPSILCFPNIDPKGAAELAELNNPKAKPKAPLPPPEPPKNYGGVRPMTSDAGKRKINMLRRFHGGLIGTQSNNMELINNVFVASTSGQDVISLSVYNNKSSFKESKYAHSAAVLPNPKMRPQSAPFKFTDEVLFGKSIRQDKLEEIAEIDSLKTKLAKDDIPFKVDTIRKAFEMPGEKEFTVSRGYPKIEDYLMKNPFPKKKKKGKKKGKKKKK